MYDVVNGLVRVSVTSLRGRSVYTRAQFTALYRRA